MTTVASHNPAMSRYDGHVDGALAGFAEYVLGDGTIEFNHTEVDEAFEGQGVAGTIARFALDDVRASGQRRVIATCPFIRRWIEKHPEYADLTQ